MKTSFERTRQRFFLIWSIIGILLLLIACGYVLGQVWTAISIILFSAFLVFIMRAPVAALEKRGVPRILGTAISFVGAFLTLALIVLIFAPIIWGQIVGLLTLIPSYIQQSQDSWNEIYQEYSYLLEDNTIKQLVAQAATEVSRWAANTASVSAGSVITVGTNLVLGVVVTTVSLVVCFWVLKDLPRISRELLIVIGPRYGPDARFIATTCSRSLGGYIRGMVIACICTGVISGIGYAIVGLPYPAVLGLFTGLMNFIPFVGPWASGIIIAGIGLFNGPIVALLGVSCTIIAQQVTDNFISPRVMSYAVELHPAVVLVVLIAGGALGGALGILAAIPLTSAAKTIFVHYFEKRTGRQLLSADGAIFKGTTFGSPPPSEPFDYGVEADGPTTGTDTGDVDIVEMVDASDAVNAAGAEVGEDVASDVETNAAAAAGDTSTIGKSK